MGIIAKRTILFHLCMHACSNPNDAAVCRIDWRRMSTYSRDFTFVSFSLLVVVVFFGIGAF